MRHLGCLIQRAAFVVRVEDANARGAKMCAAEPISAEPPHGSRLIEAADAARRQLERDLHDGAQQRLVLASLTLRRAALEARGTPAEPLVAEALDQLQEGLAELRE